MTLPGVLFAALLVLVRTAYAQDGSAPAPQLGGTDASGTSTPEPATAGTGDGDVAVPEPSRPVSPAGPTSEPPPEAPPNGGERATSSAGGPPAVDAGAPPAPAAPTASAASPAPAGPSIDAGATESVVTAPPAALPGPRVPPPASAEDGATVPAPQSSGAAGSGGEALGPIPSPQPTTTSPAAIEETLPAAAAEETVADPMASTPREQALYERLLGADETRPVSDADTPPAAGLDIEAPTVPGWLWVVGGVGGVGLLLLRSRSLKALRGPDAIAVVSRSQLGKDGSLAVVEVAEADGEKRRLLVGFGGGAPRLVADLGRPFPDAPDGFVPLAPTPLVERAEERGPRARAGGAGAGPQPSANAANAWARAVRESGGPGPAPGTRGRLERRHDLIEEVLAEREEDDVRGVSG